MSDKSKEPPPERPQKSVDDMPPERRADAADVGRDLKQRGVAPASETDVNQVPQNKNEDNAGPSKGRSPGR
jgi:hypothetical protein